MIAIKGFSRISGIILFVFFAVTMLGTVIGLIWVDGPIASRLSQYQHNWRDQWLVLGFRQLGKTWAVVWLLLLWTASTKRSRKALTVILALLLTTLLVLPLKGFIDRSRPSDVYWAQPTNASTVPATQGHSFPSGDTATVIAVSVALTGVIHWRWSLLVWTLACGIGLSRVLILAHYPSDVCVGAMIGIVCGLVARLWNERIPPVCAIWLDRHLFLVYVLLLVIPVFTWWIEGSMPVQSFYLTLGLPISAWVFIGKMARHRQPSLIDN